MEVKGLSSGPVLVALALLLSVASASPVRANYRRSRASRVLSEPYVLNLEPVQSDEYLCRVNTACTLTCIFAGNPVQAVSLIKSPRAPGEAPKTMTDIPRTEKTAGAIRSVIFTLSNVSAADEGRYFCLATNANKMALSFRTVTVFQPVRILSAELLHPSATQMTYVCQASGLPLPTVSFVSASNPRPPVTEADPDVTFETTGDVITATVTKASDAEPLACVAHNRFGIETHKYSAAGEGNLTMQPPSLPQV